MSDFPSRKVTCRRCGKRITSAKHVVYPLHTILGAWPVAKTGLPEHRECPS